MLKTTKYYSYFLTILVCIEIIYSVPLFVDYLGTKPNLIIYTLVPPFLHLLGIIYIKIGYTEYYSLGMHILGILTSVTNMLFGISFIPHLIIVIIGFKVLKNISRVVKKKDKMKDLKEELELRNHYDIEKEKKLNDYYNDLDIDDITDDNIEDFLDGR